MLDIEGAVVTADAMHTQRDTAERITGKGGDYVLALKGNQRSLHKDAKAWLRIPGMRRKCFRISKLAAGTARGDAHRDGAPRHNGRASRRRKGRAVRVSEGRTRLKHLHHEPEMSPEAFGPEPLGEEQAALGSGRPV